jgi:hypothetical protein
VALAPAHLLAAVEAPLLAAYPGRLYRLAVHYPCAGLGLASELLPQPPAQDAVQTLPKPVDAPSPEVVEHRLPRREVPRQHSPLATALEHVEDGVEDLAWAVEPRSSSLLRGRKVWFHQVPLFVSKVTRVSPAHHAMERSRRLAPFSDGLSGLDFSHLGGKGIDTLLTPLHMKR